jgi:predicted ribosomally synthesized peptide with nif11-like leader
LGKKVVEDEKLKKKAQEIGMEDVEGIITLAKENGFDVSKEDMQAAAEEMKSTGELNEDDLEQVAGGFVTSTAVAVGTAAVAVGSAVTSVTSTTSSGGW